MWTDLTKVGGVTNTVTLPDDGIVSFVIPEGIKLCAYVNGVEAPMHHIHIKAGDTMYFELKGHNNLPKNIDVNYNGINRALSVIPDMIIQNKVKDFVEVQRLNESYIKEKELDMTPAETVNLFANPGMGYGNGVGAGAGAGLGAGLLGGVLGGALLGGRRGGLLGGEDGGVIGPNLVTNSDLQSALNGQTAGQNTNVLLQTLGDIKAAIPLAEGQVQLALAGAQADINSNIAMSLQTAISGQANINQNINNAIASSLASQNVIKSTVQDGNAAINLAIANTAYALNTSIRDDGDKTRALIISQNDAMLNRQLATAEAALLEQRAIGRSREVEVNVTQTVNQNQAQLQAQAQQQQQFLITNNLLQAILSQAQVAQATNQSLIIGNSGAVVGGAQNANPTNVRA